MITREDCIKIGEVSKTHNLQGAVIITTDCDLLEQYADEPVFLLLEGAPVPFFIAEDGLTVRNHTSYIVKFDYVDSLAKAERLVGCEVLIEKELLEDEDMENVGCDVYDLIELEQAYAPPFSSAKDPVNMAGFVADNIIHERVKSISWRELQAMDKNKITLINVCTKDECALNTIKGSVNIPLDEIRSHLGEIPTDKPVVVFCAVGLRGYIASRVLTQHGYDVYNLTGGLKTYALSTAEQCSEPYNNEPTTKAADNSNQSIRQISVDACGLQCPGPVMKLKSGIEGLAIGERLQIRATDAGFARDVESWAKITGNKLVSLSREKGIITALLEKGGEAACNPTLKKADGKTIVVFNNDLDKALASFVIANGAASTGRKVTMFFTFWGLNVIKRKPIIPVKKDFMGKMFGMMLPSSSRKLKLSKMNMMGIGSRMMRGIMRKKQIDSLESLIEQASQNGVEFIACQMSMDVMGIKAEELLDGVRVGGVATYLERAEDANVNLFI